MSSIDLMRKKMVEGQVLPCPSHFPSDSLRWALSQVPREKCVAASFQKMAYMEKFVPQGENRYLMPVAVLSRSLQALEIHEKDTVFVIGAGTGYTSMILSYLAHKVVAFEYDETLMSVGERLINQPGFEAVSYKKISSLKDLQAYKNKANVIFIEGALTSIAPYIKACLKEEGRLLAFLPTPMESQGFPITTATLFKYYQPSLTEKALFLTDMPWLFPEGGQA